MMNAEEAAKPHQSHIKATSMRHQSHPKATLGQMQKAECRMQKSGTKPHWEEGRRTNDERWHGGKGSQSHPQATPEPPSGHLVANR